jgi:cytosine/adenosine deaminase-related metal-dependent hydrolase
MTMAGRFPGAACLHATASSRRSGRATNCRASADRVIDLRGRVLMPGLINTHHHLYQNLTRLLPAAQDAALFGWLTCPVSRSGSN